MPASTPSSARLWQVDEMLVNAPAERSIERALGLGPSLVRHAQDFNVSTLAASIVRGPAVVLGARQWAGRVVDFQGCANAGVRVFRRLSTGTAAWIGGSGILFSLALPHVSSLVPDATPRTLLNRNVRMFLKGFTKAGLLAHYFGREWISFLKRPAALLGFEVTRSGVVLVEVLVGFDESIALPRILMAEEERVIDRWQGKVPVSVREVLPDAQIEALTEKIIVGIVDQTGGSLGELDDVIQHEFSAITEALDPVAAEFVLEAVHKVPVGYIDEAVGRDNPTRRWLGGDVLTPSWVYEDVALGKGSDEIGEVPIDGATVLDLVNSVTTK